MKLDSPFQAQQSPGIPSSPRIAFSPWVNEEFPPWDQLLSAHDVARLTRRNRLMVPILVLCRRIPKRRRYQGGIVGWLQSEVMDFLIKDIRLTNPCERPSKHEPTNSLRLQTPLALSCADGCAQRPVRAKCSSHRRPRPSETKGNSHG